MPLTSIPFRGKTPQIHNSCFIAPNAALIGDVKIGEGSSVWYGCTLRGDVNHIHVGKHSNIQDGTVVHVASPTDDNPRGYPTLIGDYVTIGHMALIHACTIHDRALIGMKACVMDGAVVEEGAIVGAGSVVPPGKIVKANQLWLGSPARFVKDLDAASAENLKRINQVYIDLNEEYRKL